MSHPDQRAVSPAAASVGRAALWMTGAIVSFCLMAVAARELVAVMSAFQILFLRSVAGALFIGLVVVRREPELLRSRQPGLQALRHTIHFAGQVLWIVALAWLPLALVFAVEFTSPIWGALTAMLLLGERLSRFRVLAMVLGFAGVLVILRPGIVELEPAILAALGAALAFGVINAMTKKLVRTDRPWGILFWMCVSQALLCLPFAIPLWVAPTSADLPWIVAVAVTGLSAHYCLARALAVADAMVVLPMEFARLPVVALIGLLAYGEAIDPWTFLGAAVIVTGIWLNVRAEARAARLPSPPPAGQADR